MSNFAKLALLLGVAASATAGSVHQQHQHLHAKRETPSAYEAPEQASESCSCTTETIYYYGPGTLISSDKPKSTTPPIVVAPSVSKPAPAPTHVPGGEEDVPKETETATKPDTPAAPSDTPVSPEQSAPPPYGNPDSPAPSGSQVHGVPTEPEEESEAPVKPVTETDVVLETTTTCPESSTTAAPVKPETDAPVPVPTPEEEKPAPPVPMPSPEEEKPAPAPKPIPEEEKPAPVPKPTPEEEKPAPVPEPYQTPTSEAAPKPTTEAPAPQPPVDTPAPVEPKPEGPAPEKPAPEKPSPKPETTEEVKPETTHKPAPVPEPSTKESVKPPQPTQEPAPAPEPSTKEEPKPEPSTQKPAPKPEPSTKEAAPKPEPTSQAPKPEPTKEAPKPKPETTTSSPKQESTGGYNAGGGNGGSASHSTNGNKWAMTYTPYTKSGECTSADVVARDIAAIADKGFTTVRVYGTDCSGLENVGKACSNHGLNMIVGIFIDAEGIGGQNTDNQEQALIKWGNQGNWGMVEMVVVGNEAVFKGYCTGAELAAYITSVKSEFESAGSTAVFTTAETLGAIQENADAICGAVDVIAANIHPFFNNQLTAGEAGEFVASQLSDLSDACDGALEAYNLETGWPSQGNANGAAVPGTSQQVTAVDSIMEEAGPHSCMFSFGDDHWKEPGEWGVEQFWGCSELF